MSSKLYLILLLILAANNIAYANSQIKIFILHSYSQEYPWTKSQHEGFITSYNEQKAGATQISTEHLDTKRKAYTDAYAQSYKSYLIDKYAGYTPDLIYVTDDNAALFSINHLVDLFPTTPIIFSGVNNFSFQNIIDRTKVTGVFEKKEVSANIQLVLSISPQTHEIFVLGDNSNTDQAIKRELEDQLKLLPNIKATYINHNTIEDIASYLKKTDNKYLLLTSIGGIVDSKGHNQTLKEIINKITTASNIIIISMEDSYLLDGVLGGYMTSGEQQGRSAAKLAIKYQQGTAIEDTKIILNSPNEYIFNYLELKKHNIQLPSFISTNVRILNSPESFYQRNKTAFISTIISLTGLVVLLMALFIISISRKNREINTTSNKVKNQTTRLIEIKEQLTKAQEIAHLGNWEWCPKKHSVTWSDEVFRILGEPPRSITPTLEAMINFIPEDERDTFKKLIQKSLSTCKPYEVEHEINRNDGTTRYVRQIGDVYIKPEDQIPCLVSTILDITEIKQNELVELERLALIERYQNALLEWSRVDYENLEQALNRATEISANTLGVARVSIWLYNDKHNTIKCHNLYIRDQGHDKGFELHKKDFPNYFKALATGKMIVVNRAREDERTNEFTEPYLIPNNIHSMLDAPIHYAGDIIGVVCHEYTNAIHNWSSQEQEFASAIASTVSLSLEIQKRKEIEKELEHQAYHDALTKLPNRSLFIDRLDQALKLATRNQTLLAVLFLDLDNFKRINDSLGHDVGDQVLIDIAQRISNELRETDTIARQGGDEFTLIVSNFKDSQFINSVVQKLINILQQPLHINKQDLYATGSIGISVYPNDGDTADILLKNADAAMYKAKEAGRNNFEFYTHDMTEQAFERVSMEAKLRSALKNQEFTIYYQPQYDARSKTIIGMEALLRWQHHEMGMVSPARFIPIAENTGLIIELDRWVMQAATKQVSQWHKAGLKPGRLALNMATKQLEQKDLVEFIKTTLQNSDCKPEWISFEITESQIMKNPENAITLLNEISDLGIEIAVDDFGTGYSSLTYLKRLPVDKLKIDRAFIKDLPEDEEDVAIVRAIIALSKSLKLSVIAEGAENQQQVDFLLTEDCYEIQGFVFAKPMPANEFEVQLNAIKNT